MSQFDASTTVSDVVAAFPSQVAGKTFAITGPSAGGLGAAVALALASAQPSTILLLGRTEAKVLPVIKEISVSSPSTKVEFIKVDLASLESVRNAAKAIAALVSKIDVLINNAGIMGPKISLTPDGVESQFGANHLGHFLLTNLLMPQLQGKGGDARVINVSSKLYQFGPVNFADPNFETTPWNTGEAYGQSKTANILFSAALAKKLEGKGVRSYSLHPGNIQQTGLAAGMDPEAWPVVMKLFETKGMAMPAEKTVQQGAATIVAASLDPSLDDTSGAFLDDCKVSSVLDYASSLENAEKLWALSEKLVGDSYVY